MKVPLTVIPYVRLVTHSYLLAYSQDTVDGQDPAPVGMIDAL